MKLIEELEQTRDKTLLYFDLSEADLSKCYAVGKWNIKQLLNHIVDAETVMYDRIRRVISKPNQAIWGFDQDAWATGLDYNQFPLEINKDLFQSVRTAIIYLAEQYYESLGSNRFVHSETGVRTLKDEFDKVVWHNEHHLNQISQALA